MVLLAKERFTKVSTAISRSNKCIFTDLPYGAVSPPDVIKDFLCDSNTSKQYNERGSYKIGNQNMHTLLQPYIEDITQRILESMQDTNASIVQLAEQAHEEMIIKQLEIINSVLGNEIVLWKGYPAGWGVFFQLAGNAPTINIGFENGKFYYLVPSITQYDFIPRTPYTIDKYKYDIGKL